MGEAGILKPTDRVELIRREVVEMSPIGRAIVAVHGPIALADDTEPEPDVAIIRRRPVPYKEREAYAEDALLLIEVAESSLAYDRSTKLRLRTPEAGGYRDVSRVAGTGTVAVQAFPDITLTLA